MVSGRRARAKGHSLGHGSCAGRNSFTMDWIPCWRTSLGVSVQHTSLCAVCYGRRQVGNIFSILLVYAEGLIQEVIGLWKLPTADGSELSGLPMSKVHPRILWVTDKRILNVWLRF